MPQNPEFRINPENFQPCDSVVVVISLLLLPLCEEFLSWVFISHSVHSILF